MKKVLIISYYFPPVNIIASRRYGDMAPYMESFGWKPIMLTTHSVGDLPVRVPEKDIMRVGENCDSGKKVVAAEGYRGIPAIVKPFYFLYHKYGIDITSIDRFVFSWRRDVLKNFSLIEKTKPDLIIATYQPAVSLWLASALSKKLSIPWVADLRDAVSLYNTSPLRLAKQIDAFVDKQIMKSVSHIVTVSPALAKLMGDFYQKPVDVIYNGFDLTNHTIPPRPPEKNSSFTLYYAGRFHPHRIPAVKIVIDWLAEGVLPRAIFRARSLGPQEANEEILHYAEKRGVRKTVELLPSASPDVIFEEERKADILLVCEDVAKMNPISNTNMTGKLFEYMPFHAPIVAITRKDSDIRLVLEDTGRGFLASGKKELADVMRRIHRGLSPSRKENRINAYSRESQCRKLCQILDEVHQKKS